MAEHPEQPRSWKDVHPDFDGHRKPIWEMSDAERLQLAWEGTLLMHWAQQFRLQAPNAANQDVTSAHDQEP